MGKATLCRCVVGAVGLGRSAPGAGPAATPFTGTGVLPAAHAGASTGMPSDTTAFATSSRFDLRSTVIPGCRWRPADEAHPPGHGQPNRR
ncbi:MAG: hypothetical protein JOY55_06305 [Mycobacterium sp.]|nr:hypothetical protein [Mycobacterium sp.]